MLRNARFVATLAIVVLTAGCAQERAAPPPRPITVLPSAAAALTPAIYMELASSSALFAIRASELARTQARSSATRSAAATVASDQGGVASQLSYAGRRLDLLPRSALPPALQADLERLRSSGDFDADYRALVGRQLARALEAHQVFAARGSSATLKPVAGMAAPITRRDLDALRP
jgi:putative membrane protein